MDPASQVAVLLDQIRISVDRLRECWSWLALLVEPGRETRGVGQVETDAAREVQWYRAMHERAYKDWALRHGLGALGPSPAGARVSVVDAQVQVHGLVVDAARVLAGYLAATYVGPPGDVDAVLAALDWILAVLSEVRDVAVAVRLDELLQRALRVGWSAARVDGDLESGAAGVVRERTAPIDGRCPACGHRSLQLVHDGREEHRSSWHVRCVSERCVCSGTGCPCRQRVRYAGRRHAWAYGELPALWVAMATMAVPRPRIWSTTTGHGGWSDRRTG